MTGRTDRRFATGHWLAISATLILLAAQATAHAAEQRGRVESGAASIAFSTVRLMQAGTTRGGVATVLGQARTDATGNFRISYVPPADKGAVLYLVSDGGIGATRVPNPAIRLATVLGERPAPAAVVVNERTAVATAYAFAQFLDGRSISGVAPGPVNAAATLRNIVDIETGAVGNVLASPPNGNQTQTMRQFNSLANLAAGCVGGFAGVPPTCAELFALATPPGGVAPADTLQALRNIARNPGRNAAGLFALAVRDPTYRPALAGAPAAWTLALRYDGGGGLLDGPGNMVFDPDGNIWIVNNYRYRKNPLKPTCGGRQLLRLTPDGRNYPGAPYEGGGLNGAGFGIVMDPQGQVWAGNFGFVGDGCTHIGPRNSVSLFSSQGEAISPDRKGYTQGDIYRAQGMAADPRGTVWVANCGNDSVTMIPGGIPAGATNIADTRLKKPFGAAVDGEGNAWFTGNGNNRVVKLDMDGNVLLRTARRGTGIKRPMAVATDTLGNAWIANSGAVVLPCYDADPLLDPPRPKNAAVIRIAADGTISEPFRGGGLKLPWGIAVDGDDNIWIANFAGQRVSHFCGARPQNCPAGLTTGDPISPSAGYAFDGLTRNTAVQIDASGNLWVTNNWLNTPVQTNPGGRQMVVYVGIAAPVKMPVIGPPQRP